MTDAEGTAFPRREVAALEALMGKRLHVLDSGFVCLVDYLGDDQAIVEAARISSAPGLVGSMKIVG